MQLLKILKNLFIMIDLKLKEFRKNKFNLNQSRFCILRLNKYKIKIFIKLKINSLLLKKFNYKLNNKTKMLLKVVKNIKSLLIIIFLKKYNFVKRKF